MTDAHTAGPWELYVSADGAFVISAGDCVLCNRMSWPDRALESAANARLFFASRDMLAAIEAVLASNTDSYAAARQQALDAFRKAKGLA